MRKTAAVVVVAVLLAVVVRVCRCRDDDDGVRWMREERARRDPAYTDGGSARCL